MADYTHYLLCTEMTIMGSIVKEKDNSCSKEDEKLTCADGMNNLHITCTEEEVDVCANCGKEGSDLNICNKCKTARYCNAACKKKHRTKHKKKCERRISEIYDEKLFKPPPLKEDCPICMLPLPLVDTGSKYKVCCGKQICSGCIHAVRVRGNGAGLCPFCRTPTPTSDKEMMKMVRKRVEVGDAEAIYGLGCLYDHGEYGLPRDDAKAFELWHKAGELGHAGAYFNIGNAYYNGRGVERDEKKTNHCYELAAMDGNTKARHNLGYSEQCAGNWDRATKHWLIAAGDGYNDSVKNIKQLYMDGHTTKEDYTKALLAYQAYLEEVRSEQRDQAAAFNDQYKYY